MKFYPITSYKELKDAGYYPDKEFTSLADLQQRARGKKDAVVLRLKPDEMQQLGISKYVLLTKQSAEDIATPNIESHRDIGGQLAVALFETLLQLYKQHQRKNPKRANTVAAIAQYLIKYLPPELNNIAKTETHPDASEDWKKIANSFKGEASAYKNQFIKN